MKVFYTLFTALALGSCTQLATVKEVKPERVGFQTKASAPLDTLDRSITAAEFALRKLEKNPADLVAQTDYNFAVSRIIGTLRDASLKPWKTPICIGLRTLVWKRDPRPEWNPDKFDFIPTDQLEIQG